MHLLSLSASLAVQFSTKTLILVYEMLSVNIRQCPTWMWPEKVKEELAQRQCKEKYSTLIHCGSFSIRRRAVQLLQIIQFCSLQASLKPCLLMSPQVCSATSTVANRLYIPTCRACAQGWGFYIRWHPRWEDQNTRVPLIGWAQESKLPMPFF